MNIKLKRGVRRKNKSRLHEYRDLILEMREEGYMLREIAEKITQLSGQETGLATILYYLKQYPAELQTLSEEAEHLTRKPTENTVKQQVQTPEHTEKPAFKTLEGKIGRGRPDSNPESSKFI